MAIIYMKINVCQSALLAMAIMVSASIIVQAEPLLLKMYVMNVVFRVKNAKILIQNVLIVMKVLIFSIMNVLRNVQIELFVKGTNVLLNVQMDNFYMMESVIKVVLEEHIKMD